jgi:hypothetical protein
VSVVVTNLSSKTRALVHIARKKLAPQMRETSPGALAYYAQRKQASEHAALGPEKFQIT